MGLLARKPMKPFILALGIIPLISSAEEKKNWDYLDNGTIRIGIDKSRGSAIGYFALSADKRNLLNHQDEGRFIQQSYYGDTDGSTWNKTPWRYNPVQGGSYQRQSATTLAFNKTDEQIYTKVEPLHWANGKKCPEALMEQWISLDGNIATIRMKMHYTGPTQNTNANQEMPAMFVDYALPHLIFERDGKLIKHAPIMLGKDLKPEQIDYTGSWLAYVDDKDFGIGIHTPGTNQAVAYRHRGNGSTGPTGTACSYVAPVRKFPLTKNLVVDYQFHVTIGSLDQIRERFSKLTSAPATEFFTPERDKKGLSPKPQTINPSLPNVLIIGDSISIAYTISTRNGLGGKANVFRPNANCGDTRAGLANLDKWLGKTKWDVIHFNWGLHDLCYRHPESKEQGNRDKVKGKQSVPPADYEKNLEQLVTKLKATGATLIWANTTLVPEGEVGRFVGDEIKYNEIASKVMARHGIPINDLHSLSKSFDETHFTGAGDVHFDSAGSAKLAQSVISSIEKALQPKQ